MSRPSSRVPLALKLTGGGNDRGKTKAPETSALHGTRSVLRVRRRPEKQATLRHGPAEALSLDRSDPVLEDVGQAAAACRDEVRGERSNQVTCAKDHLARIVKREAGSNSEFIESMKIEASLRQPQMLQPDQAARPDIENPVMPCFKMLKQLRPIGKCRYCEL